jgi:hypothetical protein
MLSDQAAGLIRDVFERPDLFQDSPKVRKRIVAWGLGADPVTLGCSGFLVSERELLEGLPAPVPNEPSADPQIVIFASHPLPAGVAKNHFGGRCATAAPVELRAAAEPDACWIESLAAGWLFLVTTAPGEGWLLSVGGDVHELTPQSRLVAPQIQRIGGVAGQFAASPHLAWPLCSPRWLSCGSAAMGFDPLCGDGTTHAVREAILASAVISAIGRGGDVSSLVAHYQTRLAEAFRKHLEVSLPYYETGGHSEWWQREAEAIRQGIAWCSSVLGKAPAFRYQLCGFDLLPVVRST